MNDPYENLANAIIVRAIKDYRKALLFLKRHPHTSDLDTEEAKKDKRKCVLRNKIIMKESDLNDIESFLRSGWFETLSNLDGKVLMCQIRNMEVG